MENILIKRDLDDRSFAVPSDHKSVTLECICIRICWAFVFVFAEHAAVFARDSAHKHGLWML